MKICVVGLGYLGATHALAMAKLGHEVLGIDLDTTKVDSLNAGKVAFHEPSLEGALGRGVAKESRTLRTSYDSAKASELIFICVGTPKTVLSRPVLENHAVFRI